MSIQDTTIRLKTLADAELVGLAREGDRQAFGELIQRHWHKCVDLGCCFLHNRVEAEDQAQNAFLKAYEHLDRYQGKARFTTWLLSIVANHCMMLLRARRRTHLVYLDEPSSELKTPFQLRAGGPDPENALACQQLTEILRTEVSRISQSLRGALLLHDIQGLNLREVADQLGITIPAVKSRLFRAHAELRKKMARYSERPHTSSPVPAPAAPMGRVSRHSAIQTVCRLGRIKATISSRS